MKITSVKPTANQIALHETMIVARNTQGCKPATICGVFNQTRQKVAPQINIDTSASGAVVELGDAAASNTADESHASSNLASATVLFPWKEEVVDKLWTIEFESYKGKVFLEFFEGEEFWSMEINKDGSLLASGRSSSRERTMWWIECIIKPLW